MGAAVLVARFDSRSALRQALVGLAGVELGVLVPGEYAITAGTPVLLQISAPGLDPGQFLEGIVQSRVRSAHTDATEVRVLTADRPRHAYLRAWAAGTGPAPARSAWRFPVQMRAHVQTAGVARTTVRLIHVSVIDLSTGGAMVSTPRPLPLLEPLSFIVNVEGGMGEFDVRAVWSTDARAGLRLMTERADTRETWAHMVRLVEADLFARRLVPMRTRSSVPPPPMPARRS